MGKDNFELIDYETYLIKKLIKNKTEGNIYRNEKLNKFS